MVGRYAHLPLTYVAWFLPLVVLVGAREIGRRVRPWLSVALFGGLLLVMAMGPSQLAMFRFPIRAMPWIALVLIVLAVRALDGLGHERRATGGATAALLLVGFAGWLGYSANPFQGRWLLPMTLMLLAATWVACRVARGRVPAFARRVGLAAVVGLVSVGVTLGQILVVAQRSPGFGRGASRRTPPCCRTPCPAVTGTRWSSATRGSSRRPSAGRRRPRATCGTSSTTPT